METKIILFTKKSKKALAVVTALNPHNAGMYSVDLAAQQFLTGLNFSPILFRGQSRKGRRSERFGAQRFIRVRNTQALLKTDGVIYWGDFTTSPLFAAQDYTKREIEYGRCIDAESAFRQWGQIFLLSDAEHRTTKVASVGQNFLSLEDQLSHLKPTDRQLLETCYKNNFDLAFPRDPQSTKEFQRVVKGGHTRVQPGMDAAFLLDHATLFPELSSITPGGSFGYVFGRSGFNRRAFVERVNNTTGLTPVDLSQWLNLDRRKAHRQYRHLLRQISSSRFIVTDLYHAAINALALGVPVLGLGMMCSTQTDTLSDLKKKLLFETLDLSNFYVELSGPYLNTDTAVEKFDQIITECITGFEKYREGLEEKRNDFRNRLTAELCELML